LRSATLEGGDLSRKHPPSLKLWRTGERTKRGKNIWTQINMITRIKKEYEPLLPASGGYPHLSALIKRKYTSAVIYKILEANKLVGLFNIQVDGLRGNNEPVHYFLKALYLCSRLINLELP
jgi:hypothetical protein